jgi:5'(3')-deoxyribonucleotidase
MKSFLHHISEAPKGQIYCDMDGVLVDIIGGLAKLYDIKDLSNKNFDSYIDPLKPRIDKEHPHLFAELPWTKDGKQLWKYISRFDSNILSAHTNTWQPSSKQDKMKWIEKNLRPLPQLNHIVIRRDKQKFAKTNGVPNILIDDWGMNIDEWKAAGGIGIKHKSAAETIAALKKLGY